MATFEDYAVLTRLADGGHIDYWMDDVTWRIRPDDLGVDSDRVKRLEDQGFLSHTSSEPGSAIYVITDAGREELEHLRGRAGN